MTFKLTWLLFAVAGILNAAMQNDIEFANVAGVSLKMDAWVPDGPGPFPTAILVHGGGWQQGDKETTFNPIFEPLSKAGFVWFTVNYRLAPKYTYPAAIDDVVLAIRYVEAHAREFKVDLNRIAISGESAGGHIVAYIGARYADELRIKAVVPFYPAVDFDALLEGPDKRDRAVRPVMQFVGVTELNDKSRKLLQDASPVTYLHAGMPPFLIIAGTGDDLVGFRQSEELCDRMKAAGSSCEIYALKGAPHWLMRWEDHPEWQGYKLKVVEWLKGHLQ
jgi:acetyl esterase